MPVKRKVVVGIPQLTPEVLKALVPNPISAGQFEDIFQQFKKAVLERAIEDGAGSALPIGRVLADCELAVDIHYLGNS